MFEIGKVYWFKITTKNGEANLKGEVTEENQFMVRIKTEKGFEILPFSRIVNVNESRDEEK